MIETLTQIWQRLFRRSPIGPAEDFFALGGDPGLAVTLFHEIEKELGRSLPAFVIYQARTIASLAALMETPGLPPFPNCILLRPGHANPPVFLLHGLGATLLEFFELMRQLQSPNAIYGLQARGMDGLEKPCSRVEEMAQFHIDALKKVEPHGPYVLVGHSFGGLVTLEMARCLSGAGEDVSLLVMIDSYASLRHAPPMDQLRTYARKLREKIVNQKSTHPPFDVPLTPAMAEVLKQSRIALLNYEPDYYPGTVRFVRAATSVHFPDDPGRVWGKFVGNLEVESVPGHHYQLLKEQCGSLATVLSRYLQEFSPRELAARAD